MRAPPPSHLVLHLQIDLVAAILLKLRLRLCGLLTHSDGSVRGGGGWQFLAGAAVARAFLRLAKNCTTAAAVLRILESRALRRVANMGFGLHDDRDERDYGRGGKSFGGGNRGGDRYAPYGRKEEAPRGVSGNRIFVHGLAYKTSWQDLKDHARQARCRSPALNLAMPPDCRAAAPRPHAARRSSTRLARWFTPR